MKEEQEEGDGGESEKRGKWRSGGPGEGGARAKTRASVIGRAGG